MRRIETFFARKGFCEIARFPDKFKAGQYMSTEEPILILHVQEKYLAAIEAGLKLVEGRLGKEKYLSLRPGDRLRFVSEINRIPSKLICEVMGVAYYPSFREMLEKEGLAVVLPGEASVDAGVGIYRQFYSEAEENLYGVAAIFIKDNKQ